MDAEELSAQTGAQCFSLRRTKRLPGFQWIFLVFFFTPLLFFCCFLGDWVLPEDAGAAVDPVVGAGAFGRAGAELVMLGSQTVCQRLILCWVASGGSFCHTWSIPRGSQPRWDREAGAGMGGKPDPSEGNVTTGECHPQRQLNCI